jgi:hypothetical protein
VLTPTVEAIPAKGRMMAGTPVSINMPPSCLLSLLRRSSPMESSEGEGFSILSGFTFLLFLFSLLFFILILYFENCEQIEMISLQTGGKKQSVLDDAMVVLARRLSNFSYSQ